jgi:hypothetical protein
LKTIFGTVTGLDDDHAFGVGLGGALALVMPMSGAGFTLENVPAGAHDLIAGRVRVADEEFTPDRLIIRRDLNVPDGTVLPLLDFGSGEAFGPVSATLTVSGIPTGARVEAASAFSTANGTVVPLSGTDFLPGTTFPAYGIPTSRLRSGDLHTIAATSQGTMNPGEQSILAFSHELTPHSLSFVPELPVPAVGPYAPSPVPRMRAAGTIGPTGSDFGGYIGVSFVQSTRAWVMSQTRGWIGTTSSYDVRTLVLTGLPGWSEASYGVQAGAPVYWMVEARSAGNDFVPAPGALLRSLVFSGQLVP